MNRMSKIKVRDRRNKGWFFLDNEYLNGYAKHIGPIGTSIYISLCRHADAEQKCWPSQELIAEELGISDRTVRKYIKILKDHNLIEVDTQNRKGGGEWQNHVYYLLDKSEWSTVNKPPAERGSDGRSENDDIHGRNEVPTKDTKYKNTHITCTASGADVNDAIELFKDVNPSYERLYPNKTQRAALERIMKKYGKQRTTDMISFLKKSNGAKYAPTITTPMQLEDKLGQLIAWAQKQKGAKKTAHI